MQVNKSSIFRSIFSQGKNLITNGMNNIMFINFTRAKNRLLQEVEAHDVSRELIGGASSTNISGSLGGVDGNLFSFLGFPAGSNPVGDLISFLDQNITFERMSNIDIRGLTRFNARTPSRDMYKQLNLVWAPGLSWVLAIEEGNVSNLGSFIYDQNASNSRSGGGYQIKKTLRSANLRATPYVTPLIERFVQRIIKES